MSEEKMNEIINAKLMSRSITLADIKYAMKLYHESQLQHIIEQVEEKYHEIESAIESQKEENRKVPDWMKGQLHFGNHILSILTQHIND